MKFPDATGAADVLPPGTAGTVDHIGIAVTDLEAGVRLYRDLLGLELERIEEVPTEKVRVAMLKLDRAGARGHLELLQPTASEGAIAKFIAKRGPGLHHIAVAVMDIEAVMAACAAAGLELLDRTPRTGAGGRRVAFVHPKSTGGVLLELCAPAPAPGGNA
jgi:methylmalonyl-CoA/ethylmalonyl-CoA epimerase